LKTQSKLICPSLTLLFIIFLGSNFVSAQNGVLNINFGDSGKVVNQLCMGESGAQSILIHPTGNIFVGGGSYGALFNFSGIVAKHGPNGFIDSTFGQNGIVQPSTFVDWNIYDLAIQGNKMIAVGIVGIYNFAAFRFFQNGLLDSSFATDGVFTFGTRPLFGDGFAASVALQADGKIVICGETYLDSAAVVCRLKSDGNLDSTFNGTGMKKLEYNSLNTRANSLLIQPDGKIVVGGEARIAGKDEMALFKLNNNGTYDNTFGTKGVVILLGGIASSVKKVLIQNDGKIIAVCNAGIAIKVIRFLANGMLDNSYGVNGVSIISAANYIKTRANSAEILQDQSTLIVGYTKSTSKNKMITRILSDGNMDLTFGNKGFVIENDSADSQLYAVKTRGISHFFVAGREMGNCDFEPVLMSYFYQNGIGIEESERMKSEFIISPNPSNGLITIKTTSAKTLKLLNLQGQIIWQKHIEAGTTTWLLDNTPPGLYFLLDEKGFSRKIIIEEN